jgi:hypothetical protein
MDVKKACFKVISVLVCLWSLILVIFISISCNVSPETFETSTPYVDTFTTTHLRYISVTPVRGPPRTTITITGSDFSPMMHLLIWFDSNGDSHFLDTEPFMYFDVTASGDFPDNVELTVPSLEPSDYTIYIRSAFVSTVDFSIDFYITGSSMAIWIWIICGVVLVIIGVSIPIVKHQLAKNKEEKTKEKFDNGEVTLKLSNTAGKVQILSAEPFKMDKAISVRLTKKTGKQSLKVEGPLLRDRKEGK